MDKPFEVDEKLINRPPHLPGQEFTLVYRGSADNGRLAVVWTGMMQITIPREWLSRPTPKQ